MGHHMSIIHPMGPACVRYIPGPPEDQIPPYVGQDDLFGALEVELGHADLIRNSSHMWWNMEVLDTSNYSLEMGLQEYIEVKSY